MKKLILCIFSVFIPLLLILGFARKSVDIEQPFLPTPPEILNSIQTLPDFKGMIDEDISTMGEYWQKTQDTYFLIPDSTQYSEIWTGVDITNFFPKLGDTFNLLFSQIGQFFRCFVPFFQMIGATFKMVGHALEVPFIVSSWAWNTFLGLGNT